MIFLITNPSFSPDDRYLLDCFVECESIEPVEKVVDQINAQMAKVSPRMPYTVREIDVMPLSDFDSDMRDEIASMEG